MKINLFAVLTLVLGSQFMLPIGANAQTLYSLTDVSFSEAHLAIVDLQTGITAIDTSHIVPNALPNTLMTSDPHNHRLFYRSGQENLVVLDALTSTVLLDTITYSPTSTDIYRFQSFQYNPTDSTLYAFGRRDSDYREVLISINTLNGAATELSPPGQELPANTDENNSALDPYQGHFYITSLNDTLNTVDLQTGQILAKHHIPNVPSFGDFMIEFNCLDSNLYGIVHDYQIDSLYIIRIDPLTGTTTLITPNQVFENTGISHDHFINPGNNSLMYLTQPVATLGAISLTTGLLLPSMQITDILPSGYVSFAYMGCSGFSTEVTQPIPASPEIKVYPNPFSTQLVVEWESDLGPVNLTLHNAMGQQVRSYPGNTGNRLVINREELPASIYFLTLTNADQGFRKTEPVLIR